VVEWLAFGLGIQLNGGRYDTVYELIPKKLESPKVWDSVLRMIYNAGHVQRK